MGISGGSIPAGISYFVVPEKGFQVFCIRFQLILGIDVFPFLKENGVYGSDLL